VTIGTGSAGLNLVFRLLDEMGNQVDSPLISREQPHLGQITYSLSRLDNGGLIISNVLPLFNSSGYFSIQVANVTVGSY
jgi:hypothetical protein